MTEVVRKPTAAWTNQKARTVTWAGLDGDDSGEAIEISNFADKTVHVYGTWGGATLTLYGSNDPRAAVDRAAGTLFGSKTASWLIVVDAQGGGIAKTADAIEEIMENPIYLCPVVTGGDGTTSLTVVVNATKAI